MSSYINAGKDPRVGCRVRVRGPGYYRGKCTGQTGTIRAVWSSVNVAVELDFMVNENSARGYFYFNFSDLEMLDTENIKPAPAEEKGEITMELTNYCNVAKVHFLDDPFKTIECANYDAGLSVRDLCVVQTAHHGMALAEVEDLMAEPTEKKLSREIVAKVDTFDYDNRVASRKLAAELRAKMQERAKKLQDIALYQMLAKEDSEMAQLLQQFQTIGL